MRQKIKFNYAAMRELDLVCCAGRSPFAMVTRIVTAGLKKRMDHDIAVHAGLLVKVSGNILIAEMQGSGLVLNSLERYNEVGGRRWVISVRRHTVFDDPEVRSKAQEQIITDVRHTLDYDPKGLLEFVIKSVKDNPKKAYCSEYAYQVTRNCGVEYPIAYADKVSPHDLQIVPGWNNLLNWIHNPITTTTNQIQGG